MKSFLAAGCCLFLGAPGSSANAAAECPDIDKVPQAWVEHAGTLPADVRRTHLKTPLARSAPMLLPVRGVYYWVGFSVRSPYGEGPVPDSACFLLGSVAYYYNGVEGEPELDIAREVAEGREPELGRRLIELRWFDEKDGRKHRWFNVPLARDLGWFSGGDEPEDEGSRPIPLPLPRNSLYILDQP